MQVFLTCTPWYHEGDSEIPTTYRKALTMLPNGFSNNEVRRADEALAINEIGWDAPLVDIIDSLIYDGGFSADDADALALFYA